MRRYNIINNSLGWLCFVIAAITYLLTIEPTASFWDCPEFITQGYKLEVGHPPGNPIFMLTARFFVTIFGGGADTAAIAVNSMSALLSAGTILLLFWTITHLAKKLMVKDSQSPVSWIKTLVIMGSGLCGALAYTWSDTFWFSAVEGEVYAFSSFCTALVFWLILKWENRADNPRSDRYLILIAFVIGISIAVHLLNLLCIPAIVLVFYYRKFKKINFTGSIIALAISAVIVALILFGLVPGFMKVAQEFELVFVNVFGLGYNSGVLVYAVLTIGVFIWTIAMLRKQRSAVGIKFGVLFSVLLSGMLFIGSLWISLLLLIPALCIYLFVFCRKVPIRVFNTIVLSIFVIFIGYSSYALLLIRSTANTPMNQNAPDNAFTLGSYLNREQYGDTPLLFGPKLTEAIQYQEAYDEYGNVVKYVEVDENGNPDITLKSVGPHAYNSQGEVLDNGYDTFNKVVKGNPDEPDRYIANNHVIKTEVPSGMGTLFPRMYSDNPAHVSGYKSWSYYNPQIALRAPEWVKSQWAERGYATRPEIERYLNLDNTNVVEDYVAVGNSLSGPSTTVWQPSFWDNIKYFFNYQLNHMYWRYFMWNFAGRQNDIQGNGEPDKGNWISGIPFIDDSRLGDQSLLPKEYTTDNAGHNVFYMLPLLLGIIGIIWQSMMRHSGGRNRGIEQFWVIFFLFFMTGVAIVLYLNQPPGQPRERDYAFAGSFYAFAIWIGLGVAGIYAILKTWFCKDKSGFSKQSSSEDNAKTSPLQWVFAGFAVVIGIIVPIQMVSQTWDDHDRSGRYAARDFGMNYLNSLDENAIIFVNGDNDTFPLWYAQEVEGVRTDVKVVIMSYLSQDWYARQVASKTYDADGVPFYMSFTAMDYGNTPYLASPAVNVDYGLEGDVPVNELLTRMYEKGKMPVSVLYGEKPKKDEQKYYFLSSDRIDDVYVPMSRSNILAKFGTLPAEWGYAENDSVAGLVDEEYSRWSIAPERYLRGGSQSQFANLLAYDIIARSAVEGFNRPVYFASTVGNNYYMGFSPNMFFTGMAQQVTPFNNAYDYSPVAANAYANIVGKFRWGGIDSQKKVYLDETVRRMVSSTRLAILQVINDLLDTPSEPAPEQAKTVSKEQGLPVPANYGDMAQNLLDLMTRKLPTRQAPYENGLEYEVASAYLRLGVINENRKDIENAKLILSDYVASVEQKMRYALSLTGVKSQLASAEFGRWAQGKPTRSYQFETYLDTEKRDLYYVLTALSMLNYADLELAAMDGKIDARDITPEIISLLTDVNNINYQAVMLLQEPSQQFLEENADYLSPISEANALFNEAGIKPLTRVNNFVDKSGIKDKTLWSYVFY